MSSQAIAFGDHFPACGFDAQAIRSEGAAPTRDRATGILAAWRRVVGLFAGSITDILLAIPSASRDRRNKIIQSLHALPVHTRTLPGLTDLASGRVTVQDFRELDVEDLLGRAAVTPQPGLLASSLQARAHDRVQPV